MNKQAGIVVFEMVGWIGLILSIIGLIGVFVLGIGWVTLAFGTVLLIGSDFGKRALKEEDKKEPTMHCAVQHGVDENQRKYSDNFQCYDL